MYADMEQWNEIRRRVLVHGESKRSILRETGMHWRTLVYNAYVALRLIHLPEGEQPRRIRTLMRHLLLIPVEIKRHARRLKAALYAPAGWVEWWRGLLDGLLPRCALTGG